MAEGDVVGAPDDRPVSAPIPIHHIVEYADCFECGGGIGRSRETGEWMHLFDLYHKAAPEDEDEDAGGER